MLGILETRPDASTGRLMTESITRIEDTSTGRVTYSEWAAYRPGYDGEDDVFAVLINAVRKHVASPTLSSEQVAWSSASLIKGVGSSTCALKETDGGDIAVQGSLNVVRQLVGTGLVDALALVIHRPAARTPDPGRRPPRQPPRVRRLTVCYVAILCRL